MRALYSFILICLSVALVAFGTVWLYEKRTDQPTMEKSYRVDEAALQRELAPIIAGNPSLDISISLVDLQTGKSYHYGESGSYTAASISKLITATAYLNQVELGQATLDDDISGQPARSRLQKLIIESDNDAWHDLNQHLTNAGLQSYARSIGINSYNADLNTLTSDDVALLLNKLCSQKLLNSSHTRFLLDLMKQANMRNFIVAAIPEDVEVYHKVGYLQDRLHDAAVIKKKERAYVLVIFSKTNGSYNFTRGASLAKSITEVTLQSFFGG